MKKMFLSVMIAGGLLGGMQVNAAPSFAEVAKYSAKVISVVPGIITVVNKGDTLKSKFVEELVVVKDAAKSAKDAKGAADKAVNAVALLNAMMQPVKDLNLFLNDLNELVINQLNNTAGDKFKSVIKLMDENLKQGEEIVSVINLLATLAAASGATEEPKAEAEAGSAS